jgi:hypothetical protein
MQVVFYDGRMFGGTINKTPDARSQNREFGKRKRNQIVRRVIGRFLGFAAVYTRLRRVVSPEIEVELFSRAQRELQETRRAEKSESRQ